MNIMFNYISLLVDIIHSYMSGFDLFVECKLSVQKQTKLT